VRPPLEVSATLYLVRHGESEGNAARRVMGQIDLPLTETGRAQAAALGAWLARGGLDLRAVYTSDLCRATGTAAAIAAACGDIPIHVRPDLRELGRGALEGRTLAEAEELRRDPAVLQSFEPDAAVAVRMRRAGNELREAALSAPVAAVAHGGSISRLLRFWLGAGGVPGAGDGTFLVSNTGLTVIQFGRGRPEVLCVNARYHLPEPAAGLLAPGR
jgi:broad specificity phosphatase PhoE